MLTAESGSEHTQTPATRLICSYFSNVITLQNFLLELVQGVRLFEPEDDPSYQSFVRDSLVGMEEGIEKRVFTYQQPSESQGEVCAAVLN
jgi:hypothetical protein